MTHVRTFALFLSPTALINELMRNKNKINEVIVKIARVFLATNIILLPPITTFSTLSTKPKKGVE